MKHKIGNILAAGFAIVGLAALASCAGEKFHVTGSIANALDYLLRYTGIKQNNYRHALAP